MRSRPRHGCASERERPAAKPGPGFPKSRARDMVLSEGTDMNIRRLGGRFLAGVLAAGFALCLAGLDAPAPLPTIDVPDPDIGAQTLMARKAAQEATRKDFHVDCDFRFQDRQPESGITFEHHIVDDAGRFYKPVHYDHGNGIVAADVDGDGLEDIYFISQLGGNELWKNLGHGKFRNI